MWTDILHTHTVLLHKCIYFILWYSKKMSFSSTWLAIPCVLSRMCIYFGRFLYICIIRQTSFFSLYRTLSGIAYIAHNSIWVQVFSRVRNLSRLWYYFLLSTEGLEPILDFCIWKKRRRREGNSISLTIARDYPHRGFSCFSGKNSGI